MTHGELFAGMGGFGHAFDKAGMKTVWHVEIDKDARRVLERHWPAALILEDVRKAGKENLPPVDIITGGFPCQDLSVAGRRQGLDGKRSGLFYEMTRIVHELQPKFLVWENVPGLLSSNGGRDFLYVLRELARIGFHGAWTCLDLQFFGPPQRRRRIFGVFARHDIAAERCAEILSLTARSGRHSPPSGRAGEDPAAAVRSRTGRTGSPERGDVTTVFDKYNQSESEASPALCAGSRKHNNAALPLAFETRIGRSGRGQPSEVVGSLMGSQAGETSDMRPMVFMANDYQAGTFEETDKARPLTTSPDRSRAAPVVVGTLPASPIVKGGSGVCGVRRLTPL